MPEDSLLARVRAALAPLDQPLARTSHDPLDEAKVRQTVNQAARSRVAATLRQLRAARGLSYDAIRTQTGLSQQLLYDVEYRDRRLTLAELRLLVTCYGVSVDDVLGVDIESQWSVESAPQRWQEGV